MRPQHAQSILLALLREDRFESFESEEAQLLSAGQRPYGVSHRSLQEPGETLLGSAPTGVLTVVQMLERVLDQDALFEPSVAGKTRNQAGARPENRNQNEGRRQED